MMDKQAKPVLSWTGSLDYIPQVALGGLAIGAGGRVLKDIVDMFREKKRPKVEPAVSEIPVEVTPEEAEELRKRGIKVRRKLAKSAALSNMLYGAGYGAIGTGLGIAGWSLIDSLLDKIRKQKARGDVASTRKRIERLLSDEVDVEEDDKRLSAYLKAAEDTYFGKLASAEHMSPGYLETLLGSGAQSSGHTEIRSRICKKAAISLTNLLGGLGLAVGAGATLSALRSYRAARNRSDAAGKVGKLRKLLNRRRVVSPQIVMTPVERVSEEEEEEEKVRKMLGDLSPLLDRKPEATPVDIPSLPPSPRVVAPPKPVIVSPPKPPAPASGSPAQQAAVNSGWQ